MPPLLIINPPTDAAFVEACNSALASVELASGAASPDELRDLLRPMYPAVVVRPRELSDETIRVWYVYRDGHWVSSG